MTYDGRTRVLIMAERRENAVDLVMRDLPKMATDEALVKIRYAGICGTDLHIIRWNDWAQRVYQPPFALGHELCGEIVDIGPGSSFRVGDRVTIETHLGCGNCRQCSNDRSHTCEKLVTFSRLNRGAFADFSIIPVGLLRKVPENVSDKVGAIMEPLGIAVRCTTEIDCRGKGVLVSGCGPIGLMSIATAKAQGAGPIIVTDPVAERRAFALRLGAGTAINPLVEDVAERARQITDGAGVDIAIETSGVGMAISAAIEATATGGTCFESGLPEREVPINVATHIVLREVALRGVYGRRLDKTWQETADALSGTLEIDNIITDVFPLENFRDALELAQSAKVGKVLLQP